MHKRILKALAATLIENNLKKYFNVSFSQATDEQIFKALAAVATDELLEVRKSKKRVDIPRFSPKKPIKVLHYITIEFLPGRTLKNTLFNLGWENVFAAVLKQKGIDINKIYNMEVDAGLGNGGLGRLAACFMDSLATLNYPATTHCIKYDYGLFKQRIIDGQQVEFLDNWLSSGSAWLIARPDESVTVRFNGYVTSYHDDDGKLKFNYHDAIEIEAFPYDMLLSGFNANLVSNLKLWNAKNKTKLDVGISREEFAKYMYATKEIENINSVLYPSSDQQYGKSLRLRQQYFLCSASMQYIINWHIRKGVDLNKISDYIAIHINDTHPTMCIPELMRILMDDHGFSWEDAWDMVTKCISYTNHTVMQEALEVWEADYLQKHVPRIYQIICEIDRRFRNFLISSKVKQEIIDEMSIVSYGTIRMANLAVMASHKVNGVSMIHSAILKEKLFYNFASIFPDKFINITNGITHRRWVAESNPNLCEFLVNYIGSDFLTNASALTELNKFKNDLTVLKKLNQIKLANKKEFAKWLLEYQGTEINPESRFDVHIKRIHEYKRQLLNILRIIHLLNELRNNPNANIAPQTFIFAGKAASNYQMAKRIIKLINCVAAEIDNDKKVNKILKVVFVENFSVTVSEKLLPAIEVSTQISLAGQEASGTGNMKAVMNGALMMCTYDGANAEIAEHCGPENHFIFGLTPEKVETAWSNVYSPIDICNQNPKIMAVIDALNAGFDGESFKDVAAYLLCTSNHMDNYMCIADLGDYITAHEKMDALYRKPLKWAQAVLTSISNMGYFSSDRSITDYINKVWHLTKLKSGKE